MVLKKLIVAGKALNGAKVSDFWGFTEHFFPGFSTLLEIASGPFF
jgi:hypothetical protein